MAGEMLGPILLSIHNVTYYQRLTAEARAAIEAGRYQEFYERKAAVWRKPAAAATGESTETTP